MVGLVVVVWLAWLGFCFAWLCLAIGLAQLGLALLRLSLTFCLALLLACIPRSHLQVTLRAQRLRAAGGSVHPQVMHETNRTLLRLLELRLRLLLPMLLQVPSSANPRPGPQPSNSSLPKRRRRRHTSRQHHRRIETHFAAAAAAAAAPTVSAGTASKTGSVSPGVARGNDPVHDPAAHHALFPGACFVQPGLFFSGNKIAKQE